MAPRTWLVTGAASGLGHAISLRALAHGDRVILTSRTQTRRIADTLAAHPGASWERLAVDEPHEGESLIARLAAAGTEIDVLVSCAGFSIHGPAEGFAEPEVEAQLQTLFLGPYRLLRAVVPRMREQRRAGVLVNISSGATLDGSESMGPYAAAKAAMDALCDVLAKEVAPFGIRVLTVVLGGLDTNFASSTRTVAGPRPPDYDGLTTARFMDWATSGNVVLDGDADKAAAAVYDAAAVVEPPAGAYQDRVRLLMVGRDNLPKLARIQAAWSQAADQLVDVSRGVCANGGSEYASSKLPEQ